MKALKARRKYDREKEETDLEARIKEQEKELLSMTPDQRREYDEKHRKALDKLNAIAMAYGALSIKPYR